VLGVTQTPALMQTMNAGMDNLEPNKDDTDTSSSQMESKNNDIDTKKTKISSGSSQIELHTPIVNPCETMKSTNPIKVYSQKGYCNSFLFEI